MISDFFEIFLLSIIQGVSEFIPVSSAAHLILASSIYEFKNQSLLIDISLHLGSLLAILFYFKDDVFNFNKNKNLFYKIIIGTLPLIIIGYFLYVTNIIDYFRNIKVIAWATLFFGILLYIADKNKFLKKNSQNHYPATGEATLCGSIIECDIETGLAKSIKQFIHGGVLQNLN